MRSLADAFGSSWRCILPGSTRLASAPRSVACPGVQPRPTRQKGQPPDAKNCFCRAASLLYLACLKLISLLRQGLSMGGQFTQSQQEALTRAIDVPALAARLDRSDILLLREFYVTGQPYPDDATPHVLRLLADRLRRGRGPLGRLSYGAIRHRLENLVAVGLLGRIAHTNPAVYYPLDWAAEPVRRIFLLFAADFVGVWKHQEGGGL